MTTKFTDSRGKVVYTDAPHELTTAYEDPGLTPWLNLWIGICVPGIDCDDFEEGQRHEILHAPLRVEVLS